jgi:hypothetical protein
MNFDFKGVPLSSLAKVLCHKCQLKISAFILKHAGKINLCDICLKEFEKIKREENHENHIRN